MKTGFLTDFASVPPVFRRVINPYGKIGKPAVFHDELYRRPVVHTEVGGKRMLTRGECDRIFKDAMEVTGVAWIKKRLAYRGVRLGGGRPRRRYRREDVE